MPQSVPPIPLNTPKYGFSPSRFLNALLGLVLFTILSSFALLNALGFRLNVAARAFERTGIVELESRFNIPADVAISGLEGSFVLPARVPWVLPGTYTIQATRTGYTPWVRTITVRPNERTSLRSIMLLYREPKVVDVPSMRQEDLQPLPNELSDLAIKNDSEIWIDDRFVTRLSEDILSLRWFPGREHIVYQVGGTLVVADRDGQFSQDLLQTDTKSTLAYTFREGGRVLVYQDGTETKAVELFEKFTIIDRLAPER